MPGRRNGLCVPLQECGFYKESTFYYEEQADEIKLRAERCKTISRKHICCEMNEIKVINTTESRSPVSLIDKGNKYLNSDMCGVQITTNKIAFGNETALNEFPWMVMLEYNMSGILNFLCGGSLINGMCKQYFV